MLTVLVVLRKYNSSSLDTAEYGFLFILTRIFFTIFLWNYLVTIFILLYYCWNGHFPLVKTIVRISCVSSDF